MKKTVKVVLIFLLLLISAIIILAGIYYKDKFAEQEFETLFYNIVYGSKNANTAIIGIGFKDNIINLILLVILFYIPIIIISLYERKKGKSIFSKKVIYSCLVLLLAIIFGLSKIGTFKFLKNQRDTSMFFEEHYVKSDEVSITFPKEKRNLIYIFLESMETSLMTEDEGGGFQYNLIPELTKLAKENVNFSNTEKLGGAISIAETTWTASGMVAQTSATPLKMVIGKNHNSSSFLPGIYTLGDLLEEEGYNQEVMFGSDASFGGRRDYFESHGHYKIFDLNTAIEQGKMTEDEKVWWGFSDDDLYDWAKEEILNLANEDEPFSFVMLTADTHFVDGYLSENAEIIYDNQYENVFTYSSKCAYEFIKWIQEQDFYDNTTIVVVGDHIGMQTLFYKEHITDNNYVRTVYNAFINSAIPEANSKNRLFSTMDIFPTVLASMGVKIEGDRIGLGTNLFAGKKTLIEELGYDYFNSELVKKSNYYNKYLLKGDYIKMLNTVPAED